MAFGQCSDNVTATLSVAYDSVSLDPTSFDYGTVLANSSSSTIPLWSGVGIEATNDGSTAADFDILSTATSTGSSGGWTLNTTNTGNNYIHEWCNETDYECNADPGGTNYTALTDSGQILDENIAALSAMNFQLYITTPVAATDLSEQSITVTVQASAS